MAFVQNPDGSVLHWGGAGTKRSRDEDVVNADAGKSKIKCNMMYFYYFYLLFLMFCAECSL